MPTIGQLAGKSAWQQALDLAEQGRDFNNAYQGSSQQQYAGTSGSEGGGGTPTFMQFNDVKTPAWNGPDAYGLSNIVNGQEFGQGDEASLQATLARIRQFDPNANVEQATRTVGGEQTQDQTYYKLNFDQSKLPQQAHPGLTLAGPYGHDHVWNEDDKSFAFDPHYGVMTSAKNIDPHEGTDWLSILGPALVGGFGMLAPIAFGAAGLGMGAGASAAIGGAQGGLAAAEGGMGGLGAGSQLGMQLGRGAVDLARNLGSGKGFNPLSLIPLAGSGLGLPSWATSGATTLGNLARGGKPHVNPLQAAFAALRLGGGFGG